MSETPGCWQSYCGPEDIGPLVEVLRHFPALQVVQLGSGRCHPRHWFRLMAMIVDGTLASYCDVWVCVLMHYYSLCSTNTLGVHHWRISMARLCCVPSPHRNHQQRAHHAGERAYCIIATTTTQIRSWCPPNPLFLAPSPQVPSMVTSPSASPSWSWARR
jgi:hypothetical protein